MRLLLDESVPYYGDTMSCIHVNPQRDHDAFF